MCLGGNIQNRLWKKQANCYPNYKSGRVTTHYLHWLEKTIHCILHLCSQQMLSQQNRVKHSVQIML